jgi:hypothetical protein
MQSVVAPSKRPVYSTTSLAAVARAPDFASLRVQLGRGEALRFPSAIPLDLARALLEFMNLQCKQRAFRLIIDEDGIALERA